MLSSSTIDPGAQGELKAVVSTKGKQGRLTKTIRVRSNDPLRPIVRLVMTLNIKVTEDAGTSTGSSED